MLFSASSRFRSAERRLSIYRQSTFAVPVCSAVTGMTTRVLLPFLSVSLRVCVSPMLLFSPRKTALYAVSPLTKTAA